MEVSAAVHRHPPYQETAVASFAIADGVINRVKTKPPGV